MSIHLDEQRLITARENAGYTNEEIGALLGVRRETVWKWQKGVKSISVQNARRLAELLGVKISELRTELERDT